MVAFGFRSPDFLITAGTDMSVAIVDAHKFKRIAASNAELQQACLLSNERLLAQARALSVCKAFHDVFARYATYLLRYCDEPCQRPFLDVPGERCGSFGLRRTSITEAASKLLTRGIIVVRGGMIEIMDRPKPARYGSRMLPYTTCMRPWQTKWTGSRLTCWRCAPFLRNPPWLSST